ncbi:MAG: hypothetical protein ABIO67_11155, partial [Mycobacteriales bacterium]
VMRKKIATAAIIGGIGLTGGLLVGPGLASAADSTDGTSSSTGVSGRLNAFKDALKGLVSDKTITQAQADKVATTLNEGLPERGRGGHGGGMRGPAHLDADAVAKVLGVTPAELRTQMRAGKTLAQIATAQGVSKDTLVADLVKAAEAELATAVKDGKITQAQADKIKPTLTDRITEQVDRVAKAPRGDRGGDRRGAPQGATPSGANDTGSASNA